MRLLVDTNILLRASQPDSPLFETCVRAVEALPAAGYTGFLVPQVVYEYWVVATRPADVNGLAFSVEQTTLEVARLATLLPLLPDDRGVFEQWQALVTRYGVAGKNAHDARLVAAMQRHRLTHLLTLNADDFARYDEVRVLSPAELAAG
ncbi:PIN domain protein [Posidoniimonas corsicana]|uniref:PIN domain protein n=1 Tax=Posidoniimonas corsicana TaxID=1938618 RepID=A0A5C5VC64_9BACT|nr:type II toxin-antitoxin system VapC family toxin [Posidoniimonas corsicana]TWT35225.1 PIN domain protein [Posidoniimonas corsicana]